MAAAELDFAADYEDDDGAPPASSTCEKGRSFSFGGFVSFRSLATSLHFHLSCRGPQGSFVLLA